MIICITFAMQKYKKNMKYAKVMKNTLHYIALAVVLSIVCVGCESKEDIPHEPPPKIDPPVNEFLRKDFDQKVFNQKLDVYEYESKLIRRAQEQIEFDTIEAHKVRN